jgi:uncharacterized protein YndB with AHSA1/START domain
MTATTMQAPTYGVLSEPATLTLQRLLPGPLERVWAFLTDSELRQQWLAEGVMNLRPGASFELVWHNDELSASAAERPAGFPQESRASCQITEVEPLHKLRFLWPGAGDVSFELEALGDEVMLTVTHRQLPDRTMTVMVGAGWHMHLDILVARARDAQAPSFWSGWVQLRADYDRRVAA